MKEQYLVGLIIGVSMIIIGLSVYIFKLDWMISGYNTLPKEKKANIQINKIRVLFRNFFFVVGGILCANILVSYLTNMKFVHPVVIACIVVFFIITNYSIGKYDNNEKGGMPTIYRLFNRNKK